MSNKICSSSGSKFYTPIEYVWDEKEKMMVPKFGNKKNRYEMIQASKPSCDINYIVKRALAGDYTALNVSVPSYADISEVPDNLNDLHNFNTSALNQFYKLDPNIRKAFNDDVDNFIAAINNNTVNSIISDYVKNQVGNNDNNNNDNGGNQ